MKKLLLFSLIVSIVVGTMAFKSIIHEHNPPTFNSEFGGLIVKLDDAIEEMHNCGIVEPVDTTLVSPWLESLLDDIKVTKGGLSRFGNVNTNIENYFGGGGPGSGVGCAGCKATCYNNYYNCNRPYEGMGAEIICLTHLDECLRSCCK